MGRRLWFFILCLIGLGAGVFFYQKYYKPQYAKIPLHFHPPFLFPMLHVEIAGKKYQVMLDSGDADYLTLQEKVLNTLSEKKPDGTRISINIRGEEYEDPRYLIPSIRLANFELSPTPVAQENLHFFTQGSFLAEPSTEYVTNKVEQVEGSLGIGIAKHFSVFIDLPHSVMYIAANREELQKEKGFSLKGFTETPLISEEYPIIAAQIGHDMKRIILDTGASVSMLKTDKAPALHAAHHSLQIKDKDFGKHRFWSYDIPEALEIDGILGVDFLKKHAVLLDFKNQIVWIGPEQPATETPK